MKSISKLYVGIQFAERICRMTRAGLISLVLLIIPLGCAFLGPKATIYHDFDYPSVGANGNSDRISNDTIMIYNFLLAPSVDTDSLAIVESGGKERLSSRHQWKTNPADMITDLLLRDLGNSGLFQKTVDQMSTARYRYALEGTIRNLQGIVSDKQGKALFEAEVSLIDFDSPLGSRKDLLNKSYRIELPAEDSRPACIIKALNLAVRKFSQDLLQDIHSAVKQQGEGAPPSIERKKPKAALMRSLSRSGEV